MVLNILLTEANPRYPLKGSTVEIGEFNFFKITNFEKKGNCAATALYDGMKGKHVGEARLEWNKNKEIPIEGHTIFWIEGINFQKNDFISCNIELS